MRQITKQEWQRYCRHGYASVRSGQRYVLALTKGGTTNEPVQVIGVTRDEPSWAVTTLDELKAEMAGRKAAADYLAGSTLG